MRIRFAEEIFDLPPPIAGKNEVVMEISRYITFEVELDDNTNIIIDVYNIKKLFYFILREGFGLAINKVRTVLFRRKLGKSRALILAVGTIESTNRLAVGLGPQDAPFAERLVFADSLTAAIGDEDDFASFYNALSAYFKKYPEIAAGLYHWSPWSDAEPPITITDALEEGRRLAEGRAGSDDAARLSQPVSFDAPVEAPGKPPPLRTEKMDLFVVGAGGYPCSYIIPSFTGADVRLNTVIDINPACAAIVAKRYGFLHADTVAERGLEGVKDCESPVVVVATYHSTHLDVAKAAIEINPATRIMIEKPPVTTVAQLGQLLALRRNGGYIEIGYNRRHSPSIQRAKRILEPLGQPVKITCLVKELVLPSWHWYRWPNQGTRVTGNACHWLDLGCLLVPGKPISLTVDSFVRPAGGKDVILTVSFDDTSRLCVIASEDGNAMRGVQEFIDIRCGDTTIMIDDFVRLKHQQGPWQTTVRSISRDKGHVRMYREFLGNLRGNIPPGYPDQDLLESTALYIAASNAVSDRGGERIDMTAFIDGVKIPG